MDNLKRNIPFLIFIIALVIRIVYVLGFGGNPLEGDAARFDRIARNYISGKGLGTAPESGKIGIFPLTKENAFLKSWMLPVYPLFLVVNYRLFGHDFLMPKIFQAIFSALSVFLIIKIAQIIVGARIAVIAGLIAAIYPRYIFYYSGPDKLNLTTIGILEILLIMYLLSKSVKEKKIKYYIWLGITIGTAMLTNGMYVGLIIFVILFIMMQNKLLKERLKQSAIICIASFFILLPWFLRNYIVHHAIVYSTKGGHIFWESFSPTARGGQDIYWITSESPESVSHKTESKDPGILKRYLEHKRFSNDLIRSKQKEIEEIMSKYDISKMNEVDMNKAYFNMGIEWIKKNPKKLPKLFLRKFLMLWNPIELEYEMFYVFLFPFFLIGMYILSKKKYPFTSILFLPIAYMCFISLLFRGLPRYRLEVESSFIIFASAGLYNYFQASKKRPIFIVMLVAFLLLNIEFDLNTERVLEFLRQAFEVLHLRSI